MKKAIALVLALSLVLALTACGGKSEGETPAEKDTLVVMPERMVDSYDPFTASQYDTVTMNQVFDTLFMWDGSGNVVGRLA